MRTRKFIPLIIAMMLLAIAGCQEQASEPQADATGQTALTAETTPTVSKPAPPQLRLPAGVIAADMPWLSGTTAEFNITLSGIGAGYDIVDGIYPGWCLEDNFQENDVKAQLFSSYDPKMPDDVKYYRDPTIPKGALGQPVPWDKLNYLLNHKQGSMQDVGAAIWMLMWGGTYTFPSTPAAQAMYTEAETMGGGFVPQAGQVMAVILYQDGLGSGSPNADRPRQFQDTLIEFRRPAQ